MARKIDAARWNATLESIGIRTNVPPHLTDRVVEAALSHPLGNRYKLPDGKVPDLFLLVGSSGRGAWILGYRKGGTGRAGKRTGIKIGAPPAMNLDQARKIAHIEQNRVSDGLDPAQERKRTDLEQLTVGDYIATGYTEYMRIKRWPEKVQHKWLNRTANVWTAIYSRPIRRLARAEVNAVLAKRLEEGFANGTVHHDWANLRGVLHQAVQSETIPALPFQGTPEAVLGLQRNKRDRTLGKFDTVKDRANGTTESTRLMAALAAFEPQKPRIWGGKFMRALVPVLLSTGCRLSEILKLEESMVFLDCEEPHFQLPAGGYTKNKKAKRVPLNDDAFAAMREWYAYRETWPKGEARSGRGWRKRVDGGGKSVAGTFAAVTPELAAGDKRLFPLSHEYLKGRADHHDWREILTAAKIPFSGPNKLVVHDLRHTAASLLRMEGADIPTIGRFLGHSSLQSTERYTHVGDDHVRDAVMKLRIVGR